jgi:hypothetical protein
MFMRRRRPLARAAMIGGTAYVAGRAGQRAAMRQQEAAQQEVEQQPPPPAAPQQETDIVAQLTELKGLLDSGVLTQDEFDAAKRRLLAS